MKNNTPKGFVKILESIIASIVLLSVATFFFSFQRPADVHQPQFEHALAALQKSGLLGEYVKGNNADALTSTLKRMLPVTVDFSVEIIGIPNPVIRLGCVCTPSERNSLVTRLSPLNFIYRSRNIEIRMDSGSLDEMANSGADILFFFGPRTFSTGEKDILRGFVQDGTLLMIADLTQSDVDSANPDVVMDDLFGLAWNGNNAPNGRFYSTDDTSLISYRIYRHYASLGGGKNDNFMSKDNSKNRIAVDSGSVAVHANDRASLVKANEMGRGRTVWLMDYGTACPPAPAPCNDVADNNRLLKAAMLWASGERYRMDPQFKVLPSGQPYTQYWYISVLDEFEPFTAVLKVWKIFF